jgi:hypothetical protein
LIFKFPNEKVYPNWIGFFIVKVQLRVKAQLPIYNDYLFTKLFSAAVV